MHLFTTLVAVGAVGAVGAASVFERDNSHAEIRKKSWGLKKFTNLVTFGDSYTDESRLNYFIANNGTAPPPGLLLPMNFHTAGGGITWPRWVSIYSGAKLYNYAVNGAVCTHKMLQYIIPGFGPLPDVLGYEIPAYIADTQFVNTSTGTNTLYTNRKADNTVYSIWIGTNDLGNYGLLTDRTLNGTTIANFSDCVFDSLDEVYKTGGRYFVLINIQPLNLTPLYALPDAGGVEDTNLGPIKPQNRTEISFKMLEYVAAVNQILTYRTPFEVLVAHRYPGASFAIYDVHSLVKDVYNHPAAYLNGTTPVNVTDYYTSGPPANRDTDSYLWYDNLHPSERLDQIIAENFLDVVRGNSSYATYWTAGKK